MAEKDKKGSKRSIRPALSPETRENQLISLAMDRAEEKLLDGTASSQLICHFLKLGSSHDRLKRKRLESDIELAEAKIDKIRSDERVEDMYKNAIAAMREYSGYGAPIQDDEDIF